MLFSRMLIKLIEKKSIFYILVLKIHLISNFNFWKFIHFYNLIYFTHKQKHNLLPVPLMKKMKEEAFGSWRIYLYCTPSTDASDNKLGKQRQHTTYTWTYFANKVKWKFNVVSIVHYLIKNYGKKYNSCILRIFYNFIYL